MKRFTTQFDLHICKTVDAMSKDEAEEALMDILTRGDALFSLYDGDISITSIVEEE